MVFAGGGTGGHVFPLIAVADAVRALAPEIALVFVGTERGLETKVVPERGYALELLRVLPMRGNGALGAIRGAAHALSSIPKARALLARHSPSVVFSIGGYAAGPVSVAARSLGIPLALMEPNSAIGLANRLVAPLVERAYTAFPESERHFSPSRVLRTGVPLRAGFRPAVYEPGAELRVLVLGGSQGAASLNEAVPRALAAIKARVSVVHQAGAGKDEAVRALYTELGSASVARVVPFIDDMPRALAAADLVIGRAGAGAVAEICAVGRPSLLIPYPFAGDHQRHNAEWVEREGAAVMVLAHDATVPRLTAALDRLVADGALLRGMAGDATRLGRPDAAVVIARDLLRLAGAPGRGQNGAVYVPRGDTPEGGKLAASTEGSA